MITPNFTYYTNTTFKKDNCLERALSYFKIPYKPQYEGRNNFNDLYKALEKHTHALLKYDSQVFNQQRKGFLIWDYGNTYHICAFEKSTIYDTRNSFLDNSPTLMIILK